MFTKWFDLNKTTKKLIKEQQNVIESLKKENCILANALCFYAKKDSWIELTIRAKDAESIEDEIMGGRVARCAIAEINKMHGCNFDIT